jgi:hypothetical protein
VHRVPASCYIAFRRSAWSSGVVFPSEALFPLFGILNHFWTIGIVTRDVGQPASCDKGYRGFFLRYLLFCIGVGAIGVATLCVGFYHPFVWHLDSRLCFVRAVVSAAEERRRDARNRSASVVSNGVARLVFALFEILCQCPEYYLFNDAVGSSDCVPSIDG